MKPLVAAVAVLVALAVGSQAQTPELDALRARVEQGDATALRALAEQGDAFSQTTLGVMYLRGLGVPQDDAAAVRWCRLAAEQGNGVAQFLLGVMYSDGTGVPQDDVQAYMWFNLAVSGRSGNTRLSDERREVAVQGRDRVADRMTPDDRSEAQRLAREWDAAHSREP